MNTTTDAIGPDMATPHVLVVTEEFSGQLRWAYKGQPATIPVPKGYVLAVDTLGQTNVHAGMGPRHQKAVLIEHPTAQPGDVLPDHEVTAGIEAAKEKQAAVPAQRAARAAQQQKVVAASTLSPQEIAALRAIIATSKSTS